MLPAPAVDGAVAFAHAHEFDQALAESDHAWDADEEGDRQTPAALSVWDTGARLPGRKEHASADKQIPQNFCVTCQYISENDVAELPILRFCQSTQANTFQRHDESMSAGARESM